MYCCKVLQLTHPVHPLFYLPSTATELFTASVPSFIFSNDYSIIMDCSCDHLLESLAIHAIAPLFNKIVEDLITFLSSSSSSSSSDDSETEEIIHIMKIIGSMRYLDNREPIQKLSAILDLCLNVDKSTRPKEFRKFAQMNPTSFDLLVHNLKNEEIFQNNSAHEQMPIDQQILIALIRFGNTTLEGSKEHEEAVTATALFTKLMYPYELDLSKVKNPDEHRTHVLLDCLIAVSEELRDLKRFKVQPQPGYLAMLIYSAWFACSEDFR